jgi:hypothetical protein
MGHGNHDDVGLAREIKYVEWEPLKNELSSSVLGQGRLCRRFQDSGNGIVNGLGERCGAQWAAFVIPPTRFPQFSSGLGMESNSHSTGRITPRALLPRGLVRQFPPRSQPRVA